MACDRSHFYVTLFSNGSQKLYPGNMLAAFTARLAQPIDLGSMDRWEVRVFEFTCHPITISTIASLQVISSQIAFIYCELILQQFVGRQYVRCLRTFIHSSTFCHNIFENVYYMPVEKRRFQDLCIEILRQICERTKFKASDVPTKIVLHFRRVSACYKYRCRRIRHTFIMKDQLVQYYLNQASRVSHSGIDPIYSVPPFLQRRHAIGSFLSGLSRLVRPVLWSGVRAVLAGNDAYRR